MSAAAMSAAATAIQFTGRVMSQITVKRLRPFRKRLSRHDT
jgi:hypothetical protein